MPFLLLRSFLCEENSQFGFIFMKFAVNDRLNVKVLRSGPCYDDGTDVRCPLFA